MHIYRLQRTTNAIGGGNAARVVQVMCALRHCTNVCSNALCNRTMSCSRMTAPCMDVHHNLSARAAECLGVVRSNSARAVHRCGQFGSRGKFILISEANRQHVTVRKM